MLMEIIAAVAAEFLDECLSSKDKKKKALVTQATAEENLEEDTVTMTTLWYGSMTMEKISFKHLPLKKGVRHSIIEF